MHKIENFSKSQDFFEIKKNHSLKNRFIDKEFKANNDAVGSRNFICTQKFGLIKWRRAKDFYANSHFAVNCLGQFINSRFINKDNYMNYFETKDLNQGFLGDCWFIAAVAGILQNYNVFKHVIPYHENSLEEEEYTGAFHFRFWVYGSWKDIVIDDYLPTNNDGYLLFLSNTQIPNEFWCALLEKAFAKLCGSYEALIGGHASEALTIMSGGIHQVLYLKNVRKEILWDTLMNAKLNKSVIDCALYKNRLEFGLIAFHQYIVTNIIKIKLINGQVVRLVRLYNPWGKGKFGVSTEWNQKWSDSCKNWKLIDEKQKIEIDFKKEQDGEFWMSFDDWKNYFEICEICIISPTIKNITEKNILIWKQMIFNANWHFIENIQNDYKPSEFFFLTKTLENVSIGVMQKFKQRKHMDIIEFKLYKVLAKRLDLHEKKINSKYLALVGSTEKQLKFEITKNFSLVKGSYIVVPCRSTKINNEFIIRIFKKTVMNTFSFELNGNLNYSNEVGHLKY